MALPETYMRRCFELAQKGQGSVAPNPMVGAVLVHKDRVIGEGWHQHYGGAHAEVNCINSVGEEDKNLIPASAMYVNLEPCAHHGKTPPCAALLVQQKVQEVVVCNDDPFEAVKGKGFQLLQNAGIKTTKHLLRQEGLWLNRRFFCFHTFKRPYIILKWAQTPQGFFAPADGSRLQMSDKHSMQLVHKWRTEEAAVLVGTNTAVTDNPRLTARLWKGSQPLRIAIDRHLKIPIQHNLFNHEAPTWIINGRKEQEERNVKYLLSGFSTSILPQLLSALYDAGKQSLIVEGGAKLLQSFIDAGLWDEARVFITPAIIQDGIPAPLLRDSGLVMDKSLNADCLKVYTNTSSSYHYTGNLPL